ncbi:hypothetical protein NDU88_004229, partial [Pleurodeles waltl]
TCLGLRIPAELNPGRKRAARSPKSAANSSKLATLSLESADTDSKLAAGADITEELECGDP